MFPITNSSVTANRLAPEPEFTLAGLVEEVRRAVVDGSVEGVCRALERATLDRPGFLPTRFLVPRADSYARREIYADPDGKFSILAMVWGPGQGTLLHDHGGLWVVEAVYQGQVNVCNYEYLGLQNGLHQFSVGEQTVDGPGAAGYRVPPREHHVLQNTGSAPSVTIHVFGGILDTCNVFEPEGAGYRKVKKTMVLD